MDGTTKHGNVTQDTAVCFLIFFVPKPNQTLIVALSHHKIDLFFDSDLKLSWKAQTNNVTLLIKASDQKSLPCVVHCLI